MKHTVSLLLLVAIALAEPSRRRIQEGSKSSRRSERKRNLLEGNYGLRIRPDFENALQYTEDYSGRRQQKNIPSKEYGPPRVPHREYGVSKVSDVLTDQGWSVPAAIAGHLYSPVSAYQPRLRFELSEPVPSQLLYSEHKIISDAILSNHGSGPLQQLHSPLNTVTQHNASPLNAQQVVNLGENYEKQENLFQDFESQKISLSNKNNPESNGQSNTTADESQQTQSENFRNLKKYESIKQAQVDLEPQTVLTYNGLQPTPVGLLHSFLPRVLPLHHQSQPFYSEQLYQQIYPTEVQGFPPDFFQQLGQLGNQLTEKIEGIKHTENEQDNKEDEKKDKKIHEDINQSPPQTDEQTNVLQAEITTISPIPKSQPQAVSYSRFYVGLPEPSNEIKLPLQVPSPTPPPQIQPLPQPQQPQLFVTLVSPQIIQQTTPQPTLQPQLQPIQPQLQSLQPQPELFQQTTAQPILQPQLQLFQPTTLQPTHQSQLQPIQPQLQPLQPLFQPLPPQPTIQPATSVSPPQTLFTAAQQPRFRGNIRFRQRPTPLPSHQNQQTFTTSFQNQPTLTTNSQSDKTLNTQEPEFSSAPLIIALNSQPSFSVQELNSLGDEASTVSTILPQSTTESSSQQTESSTTSATVSIVPKFVSTLSTRSSSPPSSSPPFSVLTSSTLPVEPETETPLLTSLESQQTLSTGSLDSQPRTTLPPMPSSESQPIQLLSEPQILPTLQPAQVLTTLEQLPTEQTLPVTPQPLTLQTVQITPQPEVPGIRAIPVQRYEIPPAQPIQLEHLNPQQPIQFQQINQQSPVQIFEIKPLSVQFPLQVTPSSQPYEIRSATQLQVDQQQQQQSKSQQQSQLQQQSQIQQQSEIHQQSLLNQTSQLQQSQTQKQKETQALSEKSEINLVNPQNNKEARIIHAQELLYQLYSPLLQQPVYPQAQGVFIQPSQLTGSVAIPSSYSASLQATPVFTTQYFGKYAQDIFGGQPIPQYKKK